MNDSNIYSNLMGIYQEASHDLVGGLTKSFASILTIQVLVSTTGIILLLLYVVGKLKNSEDTFTRKDIIQIIIFLVFLSFFNWAIKNPFEYLEFISGMIDYIPDLITSRVLDNTIGRIPPANFADGSTSSDGINIIVQKMYDTSTKLATQIFKDVGITSFIGLLIPIILVLVLVLFQIIFIAQLLILIIINTFELVLWKSLAILLLPCLFFKQTRAIAWTYIKKLLSLAFYKPLLFMIAYLNYTILNGGLTMLPIGANLAKEILKSSGSIIVMILGTFFSFKLLLKVPEFVNGLFGTAGAADDAAGMARTIGSTAMKIGGGIAGGVGGMTKSGYTNAGGGIGGLVGGAMGGLGMSGKIGGAVGSGINKMLNATNTGQKANNLVDRGISIGTSKIFKGKK